MRAMATLLRTTLNATSAVAPGLAGRGLFAIFRSPSGRTTPHPSERALADQAMTGRLAVRGRQVVTYRWGEGQRPVLLVHGWRGRATQFGAFVTALVDAGYTPIAFDAPGHGRSSGRTTTIIEFREIMRRLHAAHGPFEAVIGHSLGGLAALFALHAGAVRARKLVTVAAVAEFDHVIEGFCAGLGLRPRLADELRKRIDRRFPGEDVWMRAPAAGPPEEADIPILAVHDEDDAFVSVSQAHRIAESYAGRTRLITTRGFGHGRVLSAPEVVAAVVDFVAQEEQQAHQAGLR